MNFPIQRFYFPMIIAILAIISAVFDQQISALLSYQRSLIGEGELWRLITGNLLHTNWVHLALNLGGLFLIWWIYNDIGTIRWHLLFFFIPMLGCTLLLYFFSPQLEGYVGLSGGLHGTIVAFGIADFLKNRLLSILLIIGVSIKLGYEQIYGSSQAVMDLIAANVAVDAHLWGAITGAVVGLVFLFLNTSKEKG